ncbi:cytochrome b/b6 domain-containing protein [uncultured Sulfitobacter sp.]|uniref:cytochrome b n=1 Tax=uncultured Sulfitobacter sp. TaxID=191468 RepID=UPI00262C047C|nr:cytochrome b/b6 domain-containing protein [uncultured Sulfitobacter sp.]
MMSEGAASTARPLRYSAVDKWLHWLVAINLGALLIFGNGLADLPDVEKAVEYGHHGWSATTLLILVVIRLVWRLIHPAPELSAELSAWQRTGARVIHRSLYVLIFAQIGLGIALASTVEQPFVASLYQIDYGALNLIADHWHRVLGVAHATVYWLIVTCLAAHVLAAVKHAAVDRDSTLRRMLPGG